MNFANQGMVSQQLPCRQGMAGSVPIVEKNTYDYLNLKAKENYIYDAAVRYIQTMPNGQAKLTGLIMGIVNYSDYLMNFDGMPAQQALAKALEICINGFVSNLVISSQLVNGLDPGLVAQLRQAEYQLGEVVSIVRQRIEPLIMSERQGGFNGLGGLQGSQPRRQVSHTGFSGNNAGGMNLMGGQQGLQTGTSVFSSSNAPLVAQGGGINLSPTDHHTPQRVDPSNQATQLHVNPPTLAVNKEVKTEPTKTDTVIYMDYELHKTFGLMKKRLPSDSNRLLMPELTLDNNLAAMTPLRDYVKLDGNVLRSDMVARHGSGYHVSDLTLSYGQRDLSSIINEEVSESLQLNRKEMERLTYTGLFLQLFPEILEDDRLTLLLNKYQTGIITHGRLTAMLEEMETILKPETMLVISEKLTAMASDYWRFDMGNGKGDLDNYYTGHDEVTEWLRRTPGKEVQANQWAQFPAKVMRELFIPTILTGDSGGHSVLSFHVSYIRIPYFAAELPIGVNNDESKGFGIVKRNSTPGLYNLCKTVSEAIDGVAHSIVLTNDGRIVNVIKPLDESLDCFYIYELKTLL